MLIHTQKQWFGKYIDIDGRDKGVRQILITF